MLDMGKWKQLKSFLCPSRTIDWSQILWHIGILSKAILNWTTWTKHWKISYYQERVSFDHSKPWLASFLLVIENLAERGDVESAERTFETFTAEGPYRSTSIYNALLKAYVNAGKKTVNFVERMSKDGFEPDSETLELLEKIESSRKDASMK